MGEEQKPEGRNVGLSAGLDVTDVHTLVGHALILCDEGKTDFPVWLFGLAERIALAIGDDDLAASTRRLASNEPAHSRTAGASRGAPCSAQRAGGETE